MASSKEYLDFIMEQLSPLQAVGYRAMMGEYVLYFRDKIPGGIFDDRLLIKPTNAALNYIENPIFQLPYEGGSKMILVENVDDSNYLCGLFEAMYEELPMPKKRKKKPRIK